MKLSLVVLALALAVCLLASPALAAPRRKLHGLDAGPTAAAVPGGPMPGGPSPPGGAGTPAGPDATTTSPPVTTMPTPDTTTTAGPPIGGGSVPGGSTFPGSGTVPGTGGVIPNIGGSLQDDGGLIKVSSEAEVHVTTDLLKVKLFLRCSEVVYGFYVPPLLQTTDVPNPATTPASNGVNSTGVEAAKKSPPTKYELRATLILVEECIRQKTADIVAFLKTKNALVIESGGIKIEPIFYYHDGEKFIIGFTAFEFVEFEIRQASFLATNTILSGVINLGGLCVKIEYKASNARLFAGELRATALATAEAVVKAKVVALVLSALDDEKCKFPHLGGRPGGWDSDDAPHTSAAFFDPTDDDFDFGLFDGVRLQLISIKCKTVRKDHKKKYFWDSTVTAADGAVVSAASADASEFSPVAGPAGGISVPIVVKCKLVVKIKGKGIGSGVSGAPGPM